MSTFGEFIANYFPGAPIDFATEVAGAKANWASDGGNPYGPAHGGWHVADEVAAWIDNGAVRRAVYFDTSTNEVQFWANRDVVYRSSGVPNALWASPELAEAIDAGRVDEYAHALRFTGALPDDKPAVFQSLLRASARVQRLQDKVLGPNPEKFSLRVYARVRLPVAELAAEVDSVFREYESGKRYKFPRMSFDNMIFGDTPAN